MDVTGVAGGEASKRFCGSLAMMRIVKWGTWGITGGWHRVRVRILALGQ